MNKKGYLIVFLLTLFFSNISGENSVIKKLTNINDTEEIETKNILDNGVKINSVQNLNYPLKKNKVLLSLEEEEILNMYYTNVRNYDYSLKMLKEESVDIYTRVEIVNYLVDALNHKDNYYEDVLIEKIQEFLDFHLYKMWSSEMKKKYVIADKLELMQALKIKEPLIYEKILVGTNDHTLKLLNTYVIKMMNIGEFKNV